MRTPFVQNGAVFSIVGRGISRTSAKTVQISLVRDAACVKRIIAACDRYATPYTRT